MGVMMDRFRMIAASFVNLFKPDGITVNSPGNYTTTTGKTWVKIQKISTNSSFYASAWVDSSTLGLVAGKTYKFVATLGDFSANNFGSFICVGNSGAVVVESERPTTMIVGQKLDVTFTYNPTTMTRIWFYMAQAKSVPNDGYVMYTNIAIYPA